MRPITIDVAKCEPLESRVLMSVELSRSFQQGTGGYTGTQDTHVRQDNPNTTYGNTTLVLTDGDDNGASGSQPVHGLIRFDNIFGSATNQIPHGSTITAATLTIYTGGGSTDGSVDSSTLYRMLTGWSESSTWNSLAGGISPNGVEARATGDATVTPSTVGAPVSFNVLQTVQAWANNASSNHGWAMLPNGSNMWRWNSSENGAVAQRPALAISYMSSDTSNQAPQVNAGQDAVIAEDAVLNLDGTVGDDGLPSGTLSTQWSKASGPGTVTFGNPSAVDTTAVFSEPGSYVLNLQASDGALSSSDTIAVTVNPSGVEVNGTYRQGVGGYTGTQDTHVRQDSPGTSYGSATVILTDGDDNGASGNQPVQALIRFDNLFGSTVGQIPAGSTVTSATLTLYTGSNSSDGSVDSSSLHRMLVDWSEVSTWNSLTNGISANGSEAASAPDGVVTPTTPGAPVSFNVLQSVQAWATNPSSNHGWAVLPNGSNMWRWNASESSDSARRPVLTVKYIPSADPVNQGPQVNAGLDRQISQGAELVLDGTVTDDGLPSGSVESLWTVVSGPGEVSFGDPTSVDTTATFSQSGEYILRLEASDGELSGSDTVAVTVGSAAPQTQLINPLQLSTDTGEKPQSKVWKHDGRWWGVFANSSGTWVWRLDGTRWTSVLKLSSSTSARADVKPVGDVTHILLYQGSSSQLASVEYSASTGTYRSWSVRPSLSPVNLSGGAETATIDIDGDGRLWVAYDNTSTIKANYSNYPYSSWSGAITLASGVNGDDIAVITSMPNGSVGVLWSNQTTRRYGFRMHRPGTSPGTWTADEVPASQSAQNNVGLGMADDHLNFAVGSDGTLYAAVKTGYDRAGFPAVTLLIRRPNGQWDNLHTVDTTGTRGIVVLNEAEQSLMVVYSFTDGSGSGDIVYRKTSLSNISFGPMVTLMTGRLNNVSATKQVVDGDALFVAGDTNKRMAGVRLTWPTTSSVFNSKSVFRTSGDRITDDESNLIDEVQVVATT